MNVTLIRKVCIDPGHGGSQPGNVNWGLREKDTTLALGDRIGHYVRLFSHRKALGGPEVKTIFTRIYDISLDIPKRAEMAGKNGCDLMLSIHTNSSINPLAKGVEAFVAEVDHHRDSSERIAGEILRRLVLAGFKSRGVKPDTKSGPKSLGVLRGTAPRMDAVLVEVGFASNPHDRAMLKNPRERETIAMAIAAAVVEHFGLSVAQGLSEFEEATSG